MKEVLWFVVGAGTFGGLGYWLGLVRAHRERLAEREAWREALEWERAKRPETMH